MLDHLGLTQSWARPITAPWGADSIAHQELVVMEDQPVEYLELIEVADAASAQPADEGQAAGDAPEPKLLARLRIDLIPANGHLSSREEAERRANNEIR